MIATKRNLRSSRNQDVRHARHANTETMDLHLAEVPPRLFLGHPNAQSRTSWNAWFDIAAWLRTPAGVMQPLQLVLKYHDDTGEQQILIDHCKSGSHRTALLNASLAVPVNGHVRRAGLYLSGVDRGIVIFLEQWHMVPQERRPKRSR